MSLSFVDKFSFSPDKVDRDLFLPKKGLHDVKIEWKIKETHMVKSKRSFFMHWGNNIKLEGEKGVIKKRERQPRGFQLIATLQKGDFLERTTETKEFLITLLPRELTADELIVKEAREELKLHYYDKTLVDNLKKVTKNLYLPKSFKNGAIIEWEVEVKEHDSRGFSETLKHFKVKEEEGLLIRAFSGKGNRLWLKAIISKGKAAKINKKFIITILPYSKEELEEITEEKVKLEFYDKTPFDPDYVNRNLGPLPQKIVFPDGEKKITWFLEEEDPDKPGRLIESKSKVFIIRPENGKGDQKIFLIAKIEEEKKEILLKKFELILKEAPLHYKVDKTKKENEIEDKDLAYLLEKNVVKKYYNPQKKGAGGDEDKWKMAFKDEEIKAKNPLVFLLLQAPGTLKDEKSRLRYNALLRIMVLIFVERALSKSDSTLYPRTKETVDDLIDLVRQKTEYSEELRNSLRHIVILFYTEYLDLYEKVYGEHSGAYDINVYNKASYGLGAKKVKSSSWGEVQKHAKGVFPNECADTATPKPQWTLARKSCENITGFDEEDITPWLSGLKKCIEDSSCLTQAKAKKGPLAPKVKRAMKCIYNGFQEKLGHPLVAWD